MATRNALVKTDFLFPGQTDFYRGKVRDVYTIGDKLVIVASDRISAFDVVLPKPIPQKGQVLNQVATRFLEATQHIIPNWIESVPHPYVAIGKKCEAFPIEMVIRGYLTGHAWREYSAGKRQICGVEMPDGMKEHSRFPEPIITPSTKAKEGHDQDISREEIIAKGLVSKEDYEQIETYTRQLFAFGTQYAAARGLILVDTKYEFGRHNGQITLIDEIHTPDSSRYFYSAGYEQRLASGEPQKQLSKEFVREWLITNGFQGKQGQNIPEMNSSFVGTVSRRYIELYEQMTNEVFVPADIDLAEIESSILAALAQ